jgi:hypothetical protein
MDKHLIADTAVLEILEDEGGEALRDYLHNRIGERVDRAEETRAKTSASVLEGTLYGPKDPDNPTAHFPEQNGVWCWVIPLAFDDNGDYDPDFAKLELCGKTFWQMVEHARFALSYAGFEGVAHMHSDDWRRSYAVLQITEKGYRFSLSSVMVGELMQKGELGKRADESLELVYDMMRRLLEVGPRELAERISNVLSHTPDFFDTQSAEMDDARVEFSEEIASHLGIDLYEKEGGVA